MRLLAKNSESKRAFCSGSASFRATMNRDATMTGRLTIVAAGAADQNSWASTLDEMAHDHKQVCSA